MNLREQLDITLAEFLLFLVPVILVAGLLGYSISLL